MTLNEGEKLTLIGALVVNMARASHAYKSKGSDMRLIKKLFNEVCIKHTSYDQLQRSKCI